MADEEQDDGIEIGDPATAVGNFQPPPDAEPAQPMQAPAMQQPSPQMEQDQAQAQQLMHAAAHERHDAAKVANDEINLRAEAMGVQTDAIKNMAEAQKKQNEVLQPYIEEHAKQNQILAAAQKDYLDRYNARVATLDQADTQMTKELDAYAARAHPTDLWSSAGVNPIQGRIAVMLSGMGQALQGQGGNPMLEQFKSMAANRAQQIMTEGRALEMKQSHLAKLHSQASEMLGDQTAANAKFQAMLLNNIAAQTQAVAGRYANPQVQAKAMETIGQLQQEAAKLNGAAKMQAIHTGIAALGAETNVFDHLMSAHERVEMARAKGTKADQIEMRKVQEGAAATDQALDLIKQLKATTNPVAKKQLMAQLAPILAKADVPGSNRILTEAGRQSELSKLGGVEIPRAIPFIGGTRVGADLDSLEDALLKQQQTRDEQFGTNTAAQLREKHGSKAADIMKQAPAVE